MMPQGGTWVIAAGAMSPDAHPVGQPPHRADGPGSARTSQSLPAVVPRATTRARDPFRDLLEGLPGQSGEYSSPPGRRSDWWSRVGHRPARRCAGSSRCLSALHSKYGSSRIPCRYRGRHDVSRTRSGLPSPPSAVAGSSSSNSPLSTVSAARSRTGSEAWPSASQREPAVRSAPSLWARYPSLRSHVSLCVSYTPRR